MLDEPAKLKQKTKPYVQGFVSLILIPKVTFVVIWLWRGSWPLCHIRFLFFSLSRHAKKTDVARLGGSGLWDWGALGCGIGGLWGVGFRIFCFCCLNTHVVLYV